MRGSEGARPQEEELGGKKKKGQENEEPEVSYELVTLEDHEGEDWVVK